MLALTEEDLAQASTEELRAAAEMIQDALSSREVPRSQSRLVEFDPPQPGYAGSLVS